MNGFALLLLCILPVEDRVLREHVDVIEVNRHFDSFGKPSLEQLIFWRRHDYDGCDHVVAWRLLKDRYPVYDRKHCVWKVIWQDGAEGGPLRVIESHAVMETWSQEMVDQDPELADREFLPKEQRQELRAR